MAVVVVAGLVSAGVCETLRRRERFLSVADEYKRQNSSVGSCIPFNASETWQGRMEAKYRRAAARPWLRLQSDPPTPSPTRHTSDWSRSNFRLMKDSSEDDCPNRIVPEIPPLPPDVSPFDPLPDDPTVKKDPSDRE
jgi:hypothetical protein